MLMKLCWVMQEGLAMIDNGHRDGKRRYWFPCASSLSAVGADILKIWFFSTMFSALGIVW